PMPIGDGWNGTGSKCECCGGALPTQPMGVVKRGEEYFICGACRGVFPRGGGGGGAQIGGAWVGTILDRRVKITQTYQGGWFGGRAEGVGPGGQIFGVRRGSVEKGHWKRFDAPDSTILSLLFTIG